MTYDIDRWQSLHLQAIKWAKANYPDSNKYRRAAFANSVSYLVTALSQGSGPSMREHLCTWSLSGDGDRQQIETDIGKVVMQFPDGRIKRAGHYTFEEACAFCAPICFGILPRLALKVYEMEHCFDDDPEDLKTIEDWKRDDK